MGNNKTKRRTAGRGGAMDPEFDSLTAALRQMHDSITNEPVPEDFLDLLDQIDAKFSASKKFS
ncbi:NepR family anti-sigma factor [Sphingorhabdus sp.]|uniref:NepR family anti-sigma factor n=1 Tax=Sphingorhabdus sp. TaxID=1902408 RepID=UPI00391DD530